MKKTNTNKKIYIFLAVIFLAGLIGISLTANARTEKRSANIKSKGIIDFENGAAVIDFSDLTYLADEIDLLEDTYKSETVDALSQISMYFNMDGTTTRDQNQSNLAIENANILPFSTITDGIINSQSIPSERTYTGTLPGENAEISGNISAADEEKMSLGTAAWVDGTLMIGTGADNNFYYNQGYTKGWADGYDEKLDNIDVEYVYHVHTGSPDNGGGCYSQPINEPIVKSCRVIVGGCEGGGTSEPDGHCTCEYETTHYNCGAGSSRGTRRHMNPPHFSSTQYNHDYIDGYRFTGKYALGCKKTEQTIESATIVFH